MNYPQLILNFSHIILIMAHFDLKIEKSFHAIEKTLLSCSGT